MHRLTPCLLATLLLFLILPPAQAQTPCGADAPCTLPGGSYYLMSPRDWDGVSPLRAVIFFHGHRSSGASVFRSGGLRETFGDNGYLVIAPDGVPTGNGSGYAWPARPSDGSRRDDVAFTLAVLEDAAARVPQIDLDHVYVTGFSAGGSMVWMMACYAGERFAGFASVAGALRRPNPADVCPAGPIRMLQIHGYADAQVPLEGRGIGGWHQGDVFESLSLARRTDRCRSNPDSIDMGAAFWCRGWQASCSGGAVRMCLHDGGHGLPRGWTDLAKDWFEAG